MAFFDTENEDYWIPLADIMTGLMLIFLLVAISYMIEVHKEEALLREKLLSRSSVLMNNFSLNQAIYKDLIHEFTNDLPVWSASLESQDLTIRFNAPDVLFATGDAKLKPQFMHILADFFPRYLKIIKPYNQHIAEVRIDGYTSSSWSASVSQDDAYFLNMQLSHQRTMSVLHYLYNLTDDQITHQYIQDHFTANGLASSHLIFNADGSENSLKSQRVEFKILLKGST